MRRWPKGTWMKLQSKETLRALIKQRGLSYQDIGTLADCHKSMVSQLVNGHRTSCSAELAEKLAVILGVPREVLFVAHASAASGHNIKVPA